MKIKLDENAIMPTRAHSTDAGLDLYSPVDFWIEPSGSPIGDNYAVIDTGVHVELPKGTVGMLKSKSGLNVKHSIIGEGVIDEGYTGSIKVKLYNLGSLPMDFKRGDKIIQLVIVPYYAPILELVDELEETERGTGGLGSTGR